MSNLDSTTSGKTKFAESEKNPLKILKVIERLEVGPVRLERNRLISPYTITASGKSDSLDLIYRYGEEVFDPEDHSSINLANIIAAQVAINYGLFCREIIFHGSFDMTDRKFIADMMMNTAREIYVKKFMEPNPFLRGSAAHLSLLRRKSYLQARITFNSKVPLPGTKARSPREQMTWKIDKSRHVILSSGGKDSLLSIGLMSEIKRDVHPIFINESGRHWFTALNGYRYLKKKYRNTAKVWTNCDRLFNWMLKHFPFVRSDFARIRSDEYPLRLWTVAVFLFGALPLLQKKGVGRLIIGDEFDSTSRQTFKGVTHYNGYYDQSLYFDNALTRYYSQKGWNISQFSIIRPLSELLIEKILAQRYPDLQRHQMSCHATHIENNRVHPCGKCEKCRRIVGMLVALDADPTNCGYSKPQIEKCLKDFAQKGVHQESAGAQHLAYLLSKKGLLQKASKRVKIKEHPEIMKIRFDPEKSPIGAVPQDIQEFILRIFLEHAEGAVRRQGKIWVEYNPLNDPALATPYLFELPEGRYTPLKSEGQDVEQNKSSPILGNLTWPEAQARLKEVDIALLPVGSTEQHGPHLPLDTDSFDANHLARQVAYACSDPKPLVLPLVPYGVSYHHGDFSGTISISPKILTQLVYEIGMSAARYGITKLVIINGHGGNIPALQFAAQMINRDAHIFTCVESGETSEKDILELTETPNDVHAGEVETSTTMALRPQMVRREKMRKFIPKFSSRYLNFSSKRSVEWHARIAKISPSGVLGDPSKASKEKGEKIWAVMIKHLAEFVEDLKNMSLDEIYLKRY